MKPFIILYCSILMFGCSNEHNQHKVLKLDLCETIVNPKHYIISRTNQDILIDGKANEHCWNQALYSESFIDIEGIKKPAYNTKFKMLWNDQYLYIYAELEEPHIWGNLRQRDTIIYYNNDFEVFIAPSGSTRNYGEIEVNSLGTVWDLLLDRPYRDQGKANNHWNLNDIQLAVHIDGTLNDSRDIDSLWTVEMAIPMQALIELKKRKTIPEEGEQWRLNFSRVEWDFDIVNGSYQRKKDAKGNYLPEYNWVWSNQKVINMHEPEKWGIVQFTHASHSNNVIFRKDKDQKIKQLAYAIFRETKFGKLKKLLNEDPGYTKNIHLYDSTTQLATTTFFRTYNGFEYILKNKQSCQTYTINELGILKSIK